ncbi:MAG TPA: SUMF1/EgtB/PvdO family nonheme iron enzyme [Smithellaceae bacterium]|nr:SUMF1/EgtB/PvdO family nonheme iron enzyme [Smithellaceae bacterium]
MPIIIRLSDIDEAIENLRYKSETTLKAKLVRAVRQYYTDDTSSETLQAIDTEDLVKAIWETGDDRELLKAKRKNFSSVKSSVNSDLKKIYAEGKNPQGLVIAHTNTFAISDEAKDKALSGIMDVFQDMGIDTQSKISKILTALSDVLINAPSDAAIESTKEEIDRLKTIMSGLSEKLGLSVEDLLGQAQALRQEGQTSAPDAASAPPMEKRQDLVGHIKDDISAIDRGLAKLAREAVEAAIDTQSDVKDALRQALAEIVDVLQDQETDGAVKAQKIMAAVEQMVGKAIDASGQELSGDQAGQLKQIFQEMSRGAEIASGAGEPEAMPQPATDQQLAGGQLLSRVADILDDTTENAKDKISRILAAVNDMIGEALDGSGLSGEEIAGLKDMMGNITANLEAFTQGALAEEDIIEEVIEEEAAETAEIVEEAAPAEILPPEEAVVEEIITEGTPAVSEEEIIEILEEEAAGEAVESALLAQEAVPAEEGIPEVLEGEAPPAGEGEIIEVIEEIIGAEELPPTEDVQTAAMETEGEIIEVPAESIAEAETATGGIGPGEGAEAVQPAGGEILEVTEEVVESEAAAAGAEMAAEEIAAELADIEAAEAAGAEELIEAGEIEEAAPEEPVEEIVEAGAQESAAEEVEIIEEIADAISPETAEDLTADAASIETLEEAAAETVELDEAELAALEEVSGDTPLTEETAAVETGGEIVEEISDADLVEEVVEEAGAGPDISVTPSDQPLDEELREKTELLSRLAEAAGVLEKLGPDLSGSIYTEDELRGKAKLLSEEFDRYLSIRDKFYNAHILIKGGDFLVGGAHLAKSEMAEQIVTLPDFYIGKFPVTNALFEIFVEQTGYITTAEKFGYGLVYYPRMQRSKDPVTGTERFTLHSQAYYKRVIGACWHKPNGPDSTLHLKRTHPVVQVSLEDARAYAAWTGKRLPTEIEWEAATRTARGNLYPWGNQWLEDACNIEKSLHGDTTPVDQYAKFANAYEVADTLGNILEWTCDIAGDKETSETCIVKGASWISHGEISLTDRHYIEKSTSSNILGFRCIAI